MFYAAGSKKLLDNIAMSGEVRMIRHSARAGVETAIHELIVTAIQQKRLLRFFYHGKIRIVEPQDYGLQKDVAHLFTYQIAGESGSGSLPDWRKFAARNMADVELLSKSFPGRREAPAQKHQQWDMLFARVEPS
jgi:hypothetical protein